MEEGKWELNWKCGLGDGGGGEEPEVSREETVKQVSRINSIKPGRHFSSLHFYHLSRQLLVNSFLYILVSG